MDERIGQHGGQPPRICAVTRQVCAGRHATHYAIGDEYYIAILDKAGKRMTASELKAVIKDCRKLLPQSTKTRAASLAAAIAKDDKES